MSRSVLVVEDEMVSSLFLTRCVQRMGHRVVGTASTGNEATAKADALRPDLVIMDVGLKGEMNGVQAAEIISRQYCIPTLFVSAYTREEIRRHGELPEEFDYLPKPVDGEQLERKLRDIFARADS